MRSFVRTGAAYLGWIIGPAPCRFFVTTKQPGYSVFKFFIQCECGFKGSFFGNCSWVESQARIYERKSATAILEGIGRTNLELIRKLYKEPTDHQEVDYSVIIY